MIKINDVKYGDVFGRLTVLTSVFKREKRNNKSRVFILTICECGRRQYVESYKLRSGHTKSCGQHRLPPANKIYYNGEYKSTEYRSWCAMIERIDNPNHNRYHRYGGRGIKVCKRWRKFKNFLKDMGKKPLGQTLDRINNDGDYKPSNCKWSTYKEQANNRSTNKTK